MGHWRPLVGQLGFLGHEEDTMRRHRIGTWALSVLVGWLAMAGGAWGQDDPASRATRAGAEFVLALSAYAAQPANPGDIPLVEHFGNFVRFCTASCSLIAPVTLSSGAQLIGIELGASTPMTMKASPRGSTHALPVAVCVRPSRMLTPG
jgi:hypothetical protein